MVDVSVGCQFTTSLTLSLPGPRPCSLLCSRPCPRDLPRDLRSHRDPGGLLCHHHDLGPLRRDPRGVLPLSSCPERVLDVSFHRLSSFNVEVDTSYLINQLCDPPDFLSCPCRPGPCWSPRVRPCLCPRPSSSSPPRWACGCPTGGWAWHSEPSPRWQRLQKQWIQSWELAENDKYIKHCLNTNPQTNHLTNLKTISFHLRIQLFHLFPGLRSPAPASGWS